MRPARAMLEALGRAGVSTQALNGAPPCGPGLLFFTEVTAPLCEFVRAASRHGLERLLAVSLSPAATAGGGAWRLLREGAADVFAWDHSADPAREVAARFERWGAIDRLVESPLVRNHLVGQSPAWIARCARWSRWRTSPTPRS